MIPEQKEFDYFIIDTAAKGSMFNRTEVLDLVRESILQSPWSTIGEMNNALVESMGNVFLNHPTSDRYLCIGLHRGVPVGLMAGSLSSTGAVGNKIAHEILWYVTEDFRKSKVGVTLKKMFEKWAKDSKASHVSLATYANDLGQGLGEYFKKQGYVPVEIIYAKELG